MRIVAVISGGLDSVTLAYALRAEGHDLSILSFDYGQRHKKEIRYAASAASRLGVKWQLIDLRAAGLIGVLGRSALTDPSVAVPDGHYTAESMKITVVPNRNAVFLAIACASAAGASADAVAIATHSGDHFIYADCRPAFMRAFEEMERLALDRQTFEIVTPFAEKSKAEIVRIGSGLNVPYADTWSCYKGGAHHCGRCGTCVERREAFELAGVNDPTTYSSEA